MPLRRRGGKGGGGTLERGCVKERDTEREWREYIQCKYLYRDNSYYDRETDNQNNTTAARFLHM